MKMLEVDNVEKAFTIPSSRRMTVRELALNFFRPGKPQRLRVLDGVSFELERGEALGIPGDQRSASIDRDALHPRLPAGLDLDQGV